MALRRVPRPESLAVRTPRLRLDLITESDADELFDVLNDPELHRFTGGRPLEREALRERIARWQHRQSLDGKELWLNWTIRLATTGAVVGYVQSTVRGKRASLAYVTGTAHAGQGIATEATTAMCDRLRERLEVTQLVARIHPGHRASQQVASHAGLIRTGRTDADGEEIWKLRLPRTPGHTPTTAADVVTRRSGEVGETQCAVYQEHIQRQSEWQGNPLLPMPRASVRGWPGIVRALPGEREP
jgi:RimJ/RimL family protein N-acetyltransferase